MTVHRDKFPYNKPTRRTNFSKFFVFWGGKSTCFGQFLCLLWGVFHCTHSSGLCHTGLLTACKRDQDVPSWSRLQAVSKPVWRIQLLCVQWKTPDKGQRICPKHVEFPPPKKKFWEISASSWFIIRKGVLVIYCLLITKYRHLECL